MRSRYNDLQSVANHSLACSFAELLEARVSPRQVLRGATVLPLLGLPLEYDEPDPAPDFDDDEFDDDESAPNDGLAEWLRAAGIKARSA
jgi:hypothetical protein